MKHGSLFSGIGGFDLASEWMGWDNIFHCEWNNFGQKVLKYYWPKAKSYEDITKTDFTIHRGEIDILTGGFPCQPYSTAGKRLGKEDDRHLWPEMLRAIREIQPTWVVGENVRGLTNWNGGMVFEEVQADLENEGYEITPFLLPACSVNAPHRRDRIWFVAYSDGSKQRNNIGTNSGTSENLRRNKKSYVSSELCSIGITTNTNYSRSDNEMHNNRSRQENDKRWKEQPQPEFGENGSDVANTNSIRLERSIQTGIIEEQNRGSRQDKKISEYLQSSWSRLQFENFPTQSPICNGDDGIPSKLDGITFPKWRNESIKAGGNAIVPQVALQIFKAIQEYEHTSNST